MTSDWWTYAPKDFLLFSSDTYYRLFELHNQTVWPAHLYVAALTFAIIILASQGSVRAGRVISGILALLWLWVAWAFHYERFATIHLAAEWYAAAFAIEAVLILAVGVLAGKLRITPDANAPNLIAYGIFLLAVFIQPLLGLFLGRNLMQSELFGIAPDPTAVATAGLLAAGFRTQWLLLLIPIIWAAVTGVTLWTLGAPDWFVTPGLIFLAIVCAIWKPRRKRSDKPPHT